MENMGLDPDRSMMTKLDLSALSIFKQASVFYSWFINYRRLNPNPDGDQEQSMSSQLSESGGTSNQKVTGPSFTDDTCISAANRPHWVATWARTACSDR